MQPSKQTCEVGITTLYIGQLRPERLVPGIQLMPSTGLNLSLPISKVYDSSFFVNNS